MRHNNKKEKKIVNDPSPAVVRISQVIKEARKAKAELDAAIEGKPKRWLARHQAQEVAGKLKWLAMYAEEVSPEMGERAEVLADEAQWVANKM